MWVPNGSTPQNEQQHIIQELHTKILECLQFHKRGRLSVLMQFHEMNCDCEETV